MSVDVHPPLASLPNSAPPTAPGHLAHTARPSAWPEFVGMTCAVLGGLGMATTAIVLVSYGLMFSGVMDGLLEMLQSIGPQAAPAANIKAHLLLLTVVESIKLLLAVVLLCAGLAIATRRPRGVTIAKAWSIAKIGFALVATLIGLWIQRDALRATINGTNLPQGAPAFVGALTKVGMVFQLMFAVAWGWALPVFLLIWFSRPRIAAEVLRWRSGAR